MKILVLNYEYPPLGGGGGIACQKLAEEYVRCGHSVECITTKFGNQLPIENIGGVTVHRIKVVGKRTLSTAGMLSLLSFPVCAYKYTAKLCKQEKFDCIHAHFSVPTGPLGIWIKKRFKLPIVLSLHGGDVYDPTKKFSPHHWWLFRKCNEWIFRNVDYVIAQSKITKEKTQYYYKCNKEIAVIPLAHDIIEFKACTREKIGLDSNEKYVISVGRLIKRKGYEFLIRAMQYVETAHLLIIGEGPEHKNLNELVIKLGLEERITLLGAKYGDEKFQYLDNCDLFVLSSVYEPFGIVIQEAMQVGLPIISTDDGGAKDMIEENINGLFIKYGNVKELAHCINYILSDQNLCNRMSECNKLKINNYSTEKIGGIYLEILSKLCNDDRLTGRGTLC